MLPSFFDIDSVIIYVFLAITLLVGLLSTGKIRTLKDYAMGGEKGFGSAVLFATLSATIVGGYCIMGIAGEIYEAGVIFFVCALFSVIGFAVSLFLVLPRMGSKFDGCLSVADMVERLYGRAAGKIAAFSGIANCVGVLCIQFIVLGNLLSGFLGISFEYALLLPSILLIVYSTLGGVRSVVMTDLIQFCVLIIMVPLLAKFSVDANGGIVKVFTSVPAEKYQIFSHPAFWAYFFIAICEPVTKLDPTLAHRFLMIKRSGAQNKISFSFIFVMIFLAIMTLIIPFSMLGHSTEIDGNQVLIEAINLYLPVGLKGLMLAGLLAAIMSTADSCLNTASILTAQLFNFSNKQSILLLKFITLGLSAIALFVSLNNFPIIHAAIAVEVLLAAFVGLPVILGLYNFNVPRHLYYISSAASVIALAIAAIAGVSIFYLTFIAVSVSAIILLSKHIMDFNYLSAIKRLPNKIVSSIVGCSRGFRELNIAPRVVQYLQHTDTMYNGSYAFFALFCILNYVLPVAATNYLYGDVKMLSVFFYSIAIVLCTVLLMRKHLGKTFHKYFGIYWLLTLLYCLPFMTTFSFLTSNGSLNWVVNMVLSTMLLASLTDWIVFVILTCLGALLALSLHILLLAHLTFATENLDIVTYSLIFSLLVGSLFIRQRQRQQEERISITQFFGGVIAHELRSPLAAVKMQAQAAEQITQDYENVSSDDIAFINESSSALQKTADNGLKTIETLLVAVKDKCSYEDEALHSIKVCIEEAIEDYGVANSKRLKQIKVLKGCEDFKFYGSKVLVQRVIENLISNAFKHGGENVDVEISFGDFAVYVKDNGKGISRKEIAKIFKRLYTGSKTGFGIGLAFCKSVMKQMDGSIECDSEIGKYTRFTLRFSNAY